MTKDYISLSAEDTIKIGKELANSFVGGEVITLSGELGVGKTVLTKGIALGLGVDSTITSPTFTIMCQYLNGKYPLYHFDMYRITSGLEAEEFGFSEYINNEQNICVIEWSENIKSILPKHRIDITIEKIGENERKIIVEIK